MKKSKFIKINPNDNVGTVITPKGIDAGIKISDDITTVEYIPYAHKIALKSFIKNEEIIKYGETIGYAKEAIPKGGWISEDKVELPQAPNLDELPIATKVPEPLPPLEGYTFLGYRNADGSVGTKNILGIMTSVQCVEGVLNVAVEKIRQELLPKYPNVDDIMSINHNYGCGVAIDAPEAKIPIRTLKNIATHPNFGGELLLVSLGCEKLIPNKYFSAVKEENIIVLQNEHGFEMMVDSIIKKAQQCLERLNKRTREVCPASDLIVGVQCGGSDAFSGVTANPAVGYAADLLVRVGATVLFSEVTEVRDGVHHLAPRVINQEVGQKLKKEIAWYDNYLNMGGVDRNANPTPGNKAGGLANVVEKSLGSIAKSGSTAIVDVLSPGEKAKKKGLIFAATPASDFVCGTCQLASGITLQVFTTGRGTPYGLSMVPVIKVSSNTELANRWNNLIDINAGKIATGEATIEDVGWELFKLILEIASGNKKAWADYWGIKNALCLFNPAPIT